AVRYMTSSHGSPLHGEWASSGDTEEGRRAHVRVDSGGGKLPAPDEVDGKPDFVARSVTLASETLGIIAKMDLVEGATWVHRLERCGMGLRQRPSEKLTLAESSTGNL